LYAVRSCLDVLDGAVFRAQQSAEHYFASGWGSSGFLIDVVCDVAGSTCFYLGIVLYYTRYPAEAHDNEDGTRSPLPKAARYTTLAVVYLQVCARSALWDHFLQRYTALLEPRSGQGCGITTPAMQRIISRFVLWAWSYSSGDHFFTLSILAIFYGRLWDFLRLSHRFGWYQLAFMVVLTWLHLDWLEKIARDGHLFPPM
jgi:hypothetical protein